jgi:GNAT superfamily N-acetyltransferase
MRVRLAVGDDARAIAVAHVRGWRAAYRGIVPDAVLDALSVDDRAAQWQARLCEADPSPRRIWVCEHGERVHGVAATAPTRDADGDPVRTCDVLLIYLVPEAWGLGYGRALLAHALDDVFARGWREASLWVFEANARARRFYERAGFAPDGARKTVELGVTPLAELRYRRTLGPAGPGA